jgi:hypothetical protein
MLERFKDSGPYAAVSTYFSNTKFFKKLGDTLLVMLILLTYGVAAGHIKLPTPAHTVRASFNQSRQIQKELDIAQDKAQANFVGNFKFHNGTQGLDGFNFMKYSLTGFSAKLGISVDAEAMQSIPIVVNMPLVAALVDDKCYSAFPNPTSPKYTLALQMGIKSYTACPVNDNKHNLVGFVIFGSGDITPPTEVAVKEAAKAVQLFQR